MEDSFVYEAKGPTLIIHLPKEFDHHNCRNLRYETDLLMAENYVSRIIFDFTRTRFMDSSGIGILLNRYKQMRGSRGSVAYYGGGTPGETGFCLSEESRELCRDTIQRRRP